MGSLGPAQTSINGIKPATGRNRKELFITQISHANRRLENGNI
jgi:hypothetical protein